jgi:hypothetical protein
MSEKLDSVYAQGSTDKDRQFLMKMKELEQEFEKKVIQNEYTKEEIVVTQGVRYKYRRCQQ